MSQSGDQKQLWQYGSAVIASVTALAGLVKSLGEIAHSGGSAVTLLNDTLLYIGNIALWAFGIFIGLTLLVGGAERGGQKGSGPPSDGAFLGVTVVSLVGGIYWGLTGDVLLGALATRAIGGALLALLAAFCAYHFVPTAGEANAAAVPSRPDALSPAGTNALIAGGVVGLVALAVLALGENFGRCASAAPLTASSWMVRRSDGVSERFEFHTNGRLTCESPTGSGRVFGGSWLAKGPVVSIRLGNCLLTGTLGNKVIHGNSRCPSGRGQWTWSAVPQ